MSLPWQEMLGFALAMTPILLTPGVSVALVVQRVARDGARGGFEVAAGTACGLLFHATTAVLGLAALVASSATAFSVLKIAGAVYLVVLGIGLIRSARRGAGRPAAPSLRWTIDSAFLQALLANVLNPRAATVHLTLVPQFIAPGDDVATMTMALVAVHIAMQTVWLSMWTLTAATAKRRLAAPRVRQALQPVSGLVLIGLGVRTVS